jgi:hypothetical protein
MRSALAMQRERKQRGLLARLKAAQDEADRMHSDAEQRAAAAALGRLDLLPDPQDALPLERAG